MASTATILAVVNLCLAMASNQSMAFRLFVGMINLAVVAWIWTATILAMVKPSLIAGRNRESSSTSSGSSSGINYEVFLSFRGPDTRKTFTDHLYIKLVERGIHVFRDDEELHAGEEIKPQLKEAIEGSKISIAILSKDYASSKSCLMEVGQMWECRKSNGHTIIPIFYDVSPYDVKRQAGDFGKPFEKHELDKVYEATIQKWREALREIGGLSGYDLVNAYGGYESQVLEEVLRRVSELLKKDERVVTDNLVGMELHIQEMMRKLGVVYNDGQAIQASGEDLYAVGICGLPGVGKTTLAKIVYNKIHMFFDECSFLEGINSKEVTSSQATLIDKLKRGKPASLNSADDGIEEIKRLSKEKKVLVVLDDVHEVAQIKALAGRRSWFGPGSRIIVTTRTRDVLNGFEDGAAEEYKLKPLSDYHALQLFRKHAFQGDACQDVSEYDSLSIDIVKTIGGLPLAIRVMASNLHREKNIRKWKRTLEFLAKHRDEEVDAPFMASYRSLHRHTREIFLDIACFFIGQDERIPSYMWEAYGYCPDERIKCLRDMHLLEDGENDELRMHDMLRDFGRKLADKKDLLHRRCRLWNHTDAFSFLEDCKRTESVKAIGLTFERHRTFSFPCKKFRKVPNLRYLRLDQAKIEGNTRNLLPNLRWLDWRACPSLSDLDNMHLEKLLILDLSRSPITYDPQIWRQIMEKVKELKVLNLRGCGQLPELLDFPGPNSLEMLILEDCILLSKIGPFISNLKRLSSLNLRKCRGVKQLPQELCRMKYLRELLIDESGIQRIHFQEGSLENLETLSARNCEHLQDISTIGCLRKLSSIALDGAHIKGLPETFEFPLKLQTLSLRNCRQLGKLPTSIGKLDLLEVMDLSFTKIEELPQSVKNLRNLKTLKMASTWLRKFPEDIVKLENLVEIDFSHCGLLGGKVRCDISGLSSLRILRLSSSNVAGLPQSISRLSCLQTLDILNCNQLPVLPQLPTSLLSLRWGSKNMRVPDLSYLTNLKVLCLKDVEPRKGGLLNLMTPNFGWITRLTSLETLELSLPNVTNLPRNFSDLIRLRELYLSHMKKLDLTQLPSTPSLSTLWLKHCNIRKPKFSSLKYLSELGLDDCDLAMIDGLEDLKLLEVLRVLRCNGITNLNGLEKLGRLRKVQIFSSPQVVLPDLPECVEVDRC